MGRQTWIRPLCGALIICGALTTGCSKDQPKPEPAPAATSTPPPTPPATPPSAPAAAAAAPAAADPNAPGAAAAPPAPVDPAAAAIGDAIKPPPSSIDPPGKSPKQKRREAQRARAAKNADASGTEVKSGW